jgi:hypothetical protein
MGHGMIWRRSPSNGGNAGKQFVVTVAEQFG